jgi:hypothetical protein
MADSYTFNMTLLSGDPLKTWRTGTMAITIDNEKVTGSVTIDNEYPDIELSGTVGGQCGMTGTQVCASGKSEKAEGDFFFSYRYDGFLADSTYMGGTAHILDYNAQESYTYVLQGYTSAREE